MLDGMVRCRSGALLLASFAVACSDSSSAGADAAESKSPVVLTGNYPLAYFARRIAGELATVEFPAPRDVDPAFWQPDHDVLREFQSADLILFNGAGYEGWAAHATLPLGVLVDTSEPFQDRLIESGEGVMHSHGPGGVHTHSKLAFTTWLDPTQAIAQAREVERALRRVLPEQSDRLTVGFGELDADLRDLDERFGAAVAQDPLRPILASHPVYQYLARKYSMDLRSVHWEPGEVPSAEQWAVFDAMLEERPAHWMLWEGPPLGEVAAALEERGVRCVVFDPCGNVPAEGDFLSVMRANATALAQAYGTE